MPSIPTDYVSIPKLTKLSTGESKRLVRAVLWRFPKPRTMNIHNSNRGGQ